MTREVLAGVGVASGADLVLDLGASHPSTHGALRLALVLDGDVVVQAEPQVGLLHRGAEKLFEVRDYRQVLVLANRHDWLSAFSNELGIAMAVERMMGLDVPERAVWLRTLLAELNRVLSHLVFLGAARRAGRHRRARGRAGGARGGHRRPPAPHGQPDRRAARRTSPRAGPGGSAGPSAPSAAGLPALAALLDERLAGPRASACCGPPRRCPTASRDRSPGPAASTWTCAATTPTSPTTASRCPSCSTAPATCPPGSGACRGSWRPRSLWSEACLARLPGGPVDVRLPKTVRAPEGAAYAWTENPLGAMGYYLVSRGQTTPWRLALRTASFNNVSVLPELLPGVRLPDLPLVLASLFFVIGDVDK